jgi:hypothetical protein
LPLALEEEIDRSILASDLKTLGKSRREENSDLARGIVRKDCGGMEGGLYLSDTISRIGVVVGASRRRRSSAATIA